MTGDDARLIGVALGLVGVVALLGWAEIVSGRRPLRSPDHPVVRRGGRTGARGDPVLPDG
ncbi:MAG TPA: hypothetical protein VGP02_02815 [Mycobacteriales bacterium]|nr:hypothetical protein [Mycobacteriales bacterium]